MLLFFGCLGEETTAIDTSDESSSVESSSSEDESSEKDKKESSATPDKVESSEKKDADSSEEKESSADKKDSSEEKADDSSEEKTDESSEEKADESSEEKADESSEEQSTEIPGGGIIFEDWNDGDAQNSLAKAVAKAKKESITDAGGYWYAYTDGEGSTVTNEAGDDIVGDEDSVGVFEDAIEEDGSDNILHVILDGSGSTEDYPVAGIGTSILYGGVDDPITTGTPSDLTGFTGMTIRAKGTGTFEVSFEATDMPDWGRYMQTIKLGDDWKEYKLDLDDFIGSDFSKLYGEFLEDQITEVLKLSLAPAGGDKADKTELYLDYIQFHGVDASKVPWAL